MCQPCDILFSDGQPHDSTGCLLPSGHDGPHRFKDDQGAFWLWETDLSCDCEHCMRCEGDYCTVYWREPLEAGPAAEAPT